MAIVDLSLLPEPQVIETLEFETLYERRKTALLTLYAGEPEAQAQLADVMTRESEPIVKLLQENTYLEMLLRQRINNAASAVMLARATGSDLDNLVANFNVTRKQLTAGDESATPPVPATYERDAELRLRAQMAFEGMSVAGPKGAYQFHALSADANVKDAGVISPAPCYVDIYVLSREGDGTANDALISQVAAALNDEDVRPVADRVTVHSAAIIRYEIVADIIMFPGPAAELVSLNGTPEIKAYVEAFHRCGMDINRASIIAQLHQVGVQNVILHSPPQDIQVALSEAAYCTNIRLSITEAGNEPTPY